MKCDLEIDIEQELHKVMQNVSLGELVKIPVITYIVVGLPYSIFQIQYTFSTRSPTDEMLR